MSSSASTVTLYPSHTPCAAAGRVFAPRIATERGLFACQRTLAEGKTLEDNDSIVLTERVHSTRQTSPSHSRQAPPTLDTSFVRSGTVDDILGAYGDSPTKARQPSFPERFDSSYTTSSSVSASTSRDEIAEMVPVLDRRDDVATATNGALRSSQRSARNRPGGPQTRSRSNTDLDLIDRLDISGLYGGGGASSGLLFDFCN